MLHTVYHDLNTHPDHNHHQSNLLVVLLYAEMHSLRVKNALLRVERDALREHANSLSLEADHQEDLLRMRRRIFRGILRELSRKEAALGEALETCQLYIDAANGVGICGFGAHGHQDNPGNPNTPDKALPRLCNRFLIIRTKLYNNTPLTKKEKRLCHMYGISLPK